MSDARDIRAKRLADEVGGKQAGASTKPAAANVVVRFGMARNLGKPEVHIPFEQFDVMSDDTVKAKLREAWGL